MYAAEALLAFSVCRFEDNLVEEILFSKHRLCRTAGDFSTSVLLLMLPREGALGTNPGLEILYSSLPVNI
jgi:hypothetical protein